MTLTWCRLTIETFVRILRTVIEIIEKSPENRFFCLFGAAFSYVSQFPAVRFCYHCTYRNLVWCEMNVDTFVQLDLTVFFKKKSCKVSQMVIYWSLRGYF